MRKLAAVGMVAVVAMSACTGTSAPWGTPVELTGDTSVHDPALALDDDGRPWLIASTGDGRVGMGAIQLRVSTDGGHSWTHTGEAWLPSQEPEWARDRIAGLDNYWAPELVRANNKLYLYYAASTFGSNTSVIGLRENQHFDPQRPDQGWVDKGEVWSSSGESHYNAIDPAVLIGKDGRAWLAFGSFWDGIQLLPLDPSTMKPPADAQPTTIASRGTATNAIEAPALLEHNGFYYLFVAFDKCCSGMESTYNINVGRAEHPEGPYLDRDGRDLAHGGGTLLLEGVSGRAGPGGQSVVGDWMAFHYYSEELGGAPQLGLRKLAWENGWPVVATEAEASEMPFYDSE